VANSEMNISLTIPVPRATWTKILDQTTDYGKTYAGSAERMVCHWATLSTDIGAVDDWIAKKALADFQNGISAQGGKLLHLQLFKSSQWQYFLDLIPYPVVSYQAVAEADVSGETANAALALNLRSPFPWAVVIAAVVIGLVAYFLIKPVLDSVNTFVYGSPSGGSLFSGVGGILIIGLLAYALISSGGGKKKNKEAKT